MYYLRNEADEIIALSSELMAILQVDHISELYTKIAKNEVVFSTNQPRGLTIRTPQRTLTFNTSSTPLKGVFGPIELIALETVQSPRESIDSLKQADHDLIDLSQEVLEPDTLKQETSGEEPRPDNETSQETFEILDLGLPVEEQSVTSYEEKASEQDEANENEPPLTEEPPLQLHDVESLSPIETNEINETFDEIVIDISEAAQAVGISEEDYETFLNEYFDTAIESENQLFSPDASERLEAIKNLAHLSDVLHIPQMRAIMEEIASSDLQNQEKRIKRFYETLARITTVKSSRRETQEASTPPQETPPPSQAQAPQDTTSREPIDLEGVEPIHFDFRLEDAAEELSLPVELIDEFVMDFIAQARTETPKMLEAYQKGDLKTVQKIGHLLKGAASNLRIVPLADRLYEIQFCEDLDKMPTLIQNYWGYFIAFENHMNLLHKQ